VNLDLTSSEYILVAIAIAGIVLAGVLVWLNAKKRKATTAGLRQRFGTEYDRAVQKHGSERKGQATLRDREKRVEKLNIRDLEPAERERFLEQWKSAQARFVDSPKEAVTEADALLSSLMQARGYPLSDFERRVGNMSVDYPEAMENYRAAHAIALKGGDSETSTEDLRTAMVHYHSLFEELLKARVIETTQVAA
jgi:type II secretory pathway pseudopilin PulG